MTQRLGYPQLTPYLVCRNAHAAIEYYCTHFGFQERLRLEMPDGLIAHAELQLGECLIMVSDEFVSQGIVSPQTSSSSPVSFTFYLEQMDMIYQNLLQDGAVSLAEPQMQFHGDKTCKIRDPFGHIWHLSTNIIPLTQEETIRRFKKFIES